MTEKEELQPEVRVVGASLMKDDGEVVDVVAVAPPEVVAHTQNPANFEVMGGIAIKQVATGRANRESGDDAYDIMMATEPTWGRGPVIASQTLHGVVSPEELEAHTTRNLSGNSQ